MKGKPHLIQLQVSQDPSWTFKKIIQPPNVHAAHVVHSACSTGSCLAYLRLNNKKQPVEPGRCSLEILGSSRDDHIFSNKTFSKATWPGLETIFFFLVVFIKHCINIIFLMIIYYKTYIHVFSINLRHRFSFHLESFPYFGVFSVQFSSFQLDQETPSATLASIPTEK